MKPLAWLLILTGVYAMILVSITVFNWLGPDRFWLGALNLYLPQVMWAVPGVVLVLLMYRVDRCGVWLPLLCVLWVFGPVMGYNWSLQLASAEAAGSTIRVMTWNIKYGRHDLAPLLEEIERCRPDVVFFQDAVDAMKGPLADYFRKWQVRGSGQYLIASRYPLSQAEVHELPGPRMKKESFLRCRMQIGSQQVSLYNVHLKTPRSSLNAFRKAARGPRGIPEAIRRFDNNVGARLVQARSIAGLLADETGPVILAGDLNAPGASLVCRTLRDAGLQDAFAEHGRGYGYTYGHFLLKHRLPWLRTSWMRIDHIMASAGFRGQRCWVGTGEASDHRPVVAEYVLITK